MPQLQDPNFSGALTYICEHDSKGAMGIIVNKPSGLELHEILEQLDIDDPALCYNDQGNKTADRNVVFAGGPVQMDRGFILHSGEAPWESSLNLGAGLWLTTSKDILHAIGSGEGPEHYLVALGYAGWGEGQLEQELKENTWLTCEADSEVLFHTATADRLKAAVASLGINLQQLSGQAGHA